MVILQCPTCDFATADVEAVGAAAILQIHGQEHQAQPAGWDKTRSHTDQV